MAKFKSLGASPRARKTYTVPLPGASFNVETGKWDGPTVDVDFVALTWGERRNVARLARADAKDDGVEDPGTGDEAFDESRMLHTLVFATLDAEVKDEEERFFDSAASIRESVLFTTDVIAMMYQQHQIWEDEASPRSTGMKPADFIKAAYATAEGDMTFFVSAQPGTQWNFTRTLAALLKTSQTKTSPSSSPSNASTDS